MNGYLVMIAFLMDDVPLCFVANRRAAERVAARYRPAERHENLMGHEISAPCNLYAVPFRDGKPVRDGVVTLRVLRELRPEAVTR